MTAQEIEKLVQDKLNEAYKANEHPKKFFVTENGRGVVDGGDLYNAVLEDVMRVVQQAMTEILKEALKKYFFLTEKPGGSLLLCRAFLHTFHFIFSEVIPQ